VNQAGQVGANTTVALFSNTSNIPGLTSMYSAGNNGMYVSARLLGVRAKLSFSNQEAFGVRVMAVLGSNSPTTNTLTSQAQQLPYTSRASGAVAVDVLGPLTGNSRVDLYVSASNKRTLGVSNTPGLADAYSNSWDSATDSSVTATAGLSLILLVLSAVNLVSGVLCQIEAQVDYEFFSVNQNKSS